MVAPSTINGLPVHDHSGAGQGGQLADYLAVSGSASGATANAQRFLSGIKDNTLVTDRIVYVGNDGQLFTSPRFKFTETVPGARRLQVDSVTGGDTGGIQFRMETAPGSGVFTVRMEIQPGSANLGDELRVTKPPTFPSSTGTFMANFVSDLLPAQPDRTPVVAIANHLDAPGLLLLFQDQVTGPTYDWRAGFWRDAIKWGPTGFSNELGFDTGIQRTASARLNLFASGNTQIEFDVNGSTIGWFSATRFVAGKEFAFKDATAFEGRLSHTITAARTWTFPDQTGTLAILGLAQTWSAAQTYSAGILSNIIRMNGAADIEIRNNGNTTIARWRISDNALLLLHALEIDGALDHDGSTVGFYGVTPAARPAGYTQTYATASRVHAETAANTAHALNATFNDVEVEAALDALGVRVNELKALVNQVIDDQQANGLFA